MRVALYIRVSSEEQAIHGLSIEAQTEALDKWAKDERAEIVGRYIDAGISARKSALKRPALQRLLNDVRNNRVDLIVFTKLDRWFRNIAEYYKVQEVLEAYNVNWKTTQEDYDTATASGRLKINIMLSVAQDEADRASERIKAVFDSKIQRLEPISGKVPFGYKIENKRIVVDPDTAPIAQDLFRQYVACRSIRALTKYAMDNHRLIYTPTGLRMFLTNERYIGKAHGQNFCEPLIDRSTWDITQAAIERRAQRNGARTDRIYLFAGLVYCAECGNRLSSHLVANKYAYYRCTRYEKLHRCTHKKCTSELVLERMLLEKSIEKFEQYNSQLAKSALARPRIDEAAIKRKMEKLKDLYLNDLIDRASYEHDYIVLRETLQEALENNVPVPKPIDIQEMKNAFASYNTLTRELQKEFWSRVMGKIVIPNNDKDFFIVPNLSYDN